MMRSGYLLTTLKARKKRESVNELQKLVNDLWSFIENVTEDDPERTEKFFALRERVRALGEKPARVTAGLPWPKCNQCDSRKTTNQNNGAWICDQCGHEMTEAEALGG